MIVAEVGVNHNGSLERAIEMIGVAKAAGCDAVKFGTFKAAEFCAPDDPLYEMFKSCELPDYAWRILKREADRQGIIFFSTPQNESDLALLLDVGVPCIKVGSDDLTNLALLRAYRRAALPMILSTGMADLVDVEIAVAVLSALVWDIPNIPLTVCVCTSEYPCPPEHANLARIRTLRALFKDVEIGFSDHTVGPSAAIVAAALGATYFEKHFTLDNSLPGPDHAFSANPAQLAEWVRAIKNASVMLGDGEFEPTEAERINRQKWRRTSGQRIRGVADGLKQSASQ